MNKSITEAPLTTLLCLKIHGSDASTFLQSQLTIDVDRIENGQSRMAAYCEPKGRVISTLVLAFIDGDFYMLIPTVLKDDVLNTLLKYRFRAKVEFDPAADSQVYAATVNSTGIIIPHPLDELRSYRVGSAGHADKSVSTKELAAWSMADFDSGMVWLDQRTSCRHLPQSLGLIANNAVDFDKGCYPGQEIIARLKYLGKAKHTIRKFHTRINSDALAAANYLRDHSGKRQGQRLNSISLDSNAHGLAVVSCAALATDSRLYFADENAQRIGGDIVFDQA
ncbi:MAG: hypothetical protein L3J24_01335 [Xanthomonadales bacterium]|nr:hypothetical protein [Xanthomonadales bacterium]